MGLFTPEPEVNKPYVPPKFEPIPDPPKMPSYKPEPRTATHDPNIPYRPPTEKPDQKIVPYYHKFPKYETTTKYYEKQYGKKYEITYEKKEYEEPKYEPTTKKYEEDKYEAPKEETYEAPKEETYEEPKYEAPKEETYEAPKYGASKEETYEEPKYGASKEDTSRTKILN